MDKVCVYDAEFRKLGYTLCGWNGDRAAYALQACCDAQRDGFALMQIVQGGEVVGIASWDVLDDGSIYVGDLAAKRSGCGRPLMDAFFILGRRIRLTPGSYRARRFYLSLGFVANAKSDVGELVWEAYGR